MSKSHNLPTIKVLIEEALEVYKKHALVYISLLFITYLLLIPNMVIDISPRDSVSTTLRIGSIICEVASLYFVVAFIKSVIHAVEGNPPSFKDALPNILSAIRPISTLLVLALLSIPIFAFFGVVVQFSWYKINILTILSAIILLIPVLFVGFIITGTFLFSVKYQTWPMRSIRDFWNRTKDAFIPFFLRYAGLFLFMIVFIIIIGFLSGILIRYVSPDVLALVIVGVSSIFFLMPLIYFALVKLLFTDYRNHNLPMEQLLELTPPQGVEN